MTFWCDLQRSAVVYRRAMLCDLTTPPVFKLLFRLVAAIEIARLFQFPRRRIVMRDALRLPLNAIGRDLMIDGLIRRYLTEETRDGLTGSEGVTVNRLEPRGS